MVHTLVTGASHGLGRACAEYLENKGHKVTKLEGKKDCNFNNKADVHSLGSWLKHLDLDNIVHCAGGGFGKKDPLLQWEDFELLFNVNLNSIATINRLAIPSMITKGKGNIIHVSSIASKQTGASVGYSAIKAGLNAYSKSLAREFANENIRINCITPGTILAKDNNWGRYLSEEAAWLDEYIDKNCPTKKLGDVNQVVSLIEFLLDDKSDGINGAIISIDNCESVYI